MSLLQRRIAKGKALKCRHVGKVLQRVLDGEADRLTAQAVQRHLDACRDCGLEASVYEEITAALARHAPAVPAEAVDRLQHFGRALAAGRVELDD